MLSAPASIAAITPAALTAAFGLGSAHLLLERSVLADALSQAHLQG